MYETTKSDVLRKIEDLTLAVIDLITQGTPNAYITSIHDNGNGLKFGICNERNRFRCATIMYLVSNIYKMILQDLKCTRRELYYQDVSFWKSQRKVDEAMKFVCGLLDVAPWELGVFSTCKGLIAGSVTITMFSGESIDCSKPGGTLIPNDVSSIKTITTRARYVLLVEKDTVFQKLLDGAKDGGSTPDYLLITGKGYPDIGTRYMVKYLNETCNIPIFAVVDADPHGIHIMLVYRFGPRKPLRYEKWLAVENIKWLGVHPTDIIRLNVSTVSLTERDRKMLNSLSDLEYVRSNDKLLEQVNALSKLGRKAEIEDVAKLSSRYLTNMYIPCKLKNGEYF